MTFYDYFGQIPSFYMTINRLLHLLFMHFNSAMNFKPLVTLRFLMIIFVVSSLLFTISYIFKMWSVSNTRSGLPNQDLNRIDKLLNSKEQAALIRNIVQESLAEILKAKVHQASEEKKETIAIEKSPRKGKTLNPEFLQRIFHHSNSLHKNHSIRNSELEAFQIQVTLEERHMMYRLLEVFDNVMKKNNVTYFMYGGTLLGSFRHHDLIPWDDDIDVMVPLTERDKMPKLFKHLSPDFILYRAGGHDKFYHKSGKKASSYNWLWPYVDVSYYELNGTFIKDWIRTYSYWYYFPKEIVFPLHNRPLLNMSLPAPKDTFAFLTWSYNYGSPCIMYGYSHMVEGGGPAGNIDCSTLSSKFPFVEHLPDQNGVREVLKYQDLIIQDIVLPEPTYAVAETFRLSLKTGYSMPKGITPPPS